MRILLGLLTLGAALLGWAVAVEPARLVVTRIAATVAQWPPGAPPLTVVFLTDLHVGSPHVDVARLDALVAQAMAERPDVVLLGGDYVVQGVVGGHPAPPEEIAAHLRPLTPPLGTFAVLGNHDWWLDGPRVRRALEGSGIRVLENQSADLGRIWLAGLADDTTRRPDGFAAFAGIPLDRPVLGLMHDPASIGQWPRPPVLTLAGHTHGGQVRLPGIGALIVPGRAPRAHSYGWVDTEGQRIFVSAGIGTSILPVRLGAPPEMVVLTLRPQG